MNRPTAKQAPAIPDSSPVARSAETAPAHSDKPVTKSADVDRYATTTKAPTPAAVPAAVVKEEKAKTKTKDTREVAKDEKKKKEPTPAKADDAPAVKLASHS